MTIEKLQIFITIKNLILIKQTRILFQRSNRQEEMNSKSIRETTLKSEQLLRTINLQSDLLVLNKSGTTPRTPTEMCLKMLFESKLKRQRQAKPSTHMWRIMDLITNPIILLLKHLWIQNFMLQPRIRQITKLLLLCLIEKITLPALIGIRADMTLLSLINPHLKTLLLINRLEGSTQLKDIKTIN